MSMTRENDPLLESFKRAYDRPILDIVQAFLRDENYALHLLSDKLILLETDPTLKREVKSFVTDLMENVSESKAEQSDEMLLRKKILLGFAFQVGLGVDVDLSTARKYYEDVISIKKMTGNNQNTLDLIAVAQVLLVDLIQRNWTTSVTPANESKQENKSDDDSDSDEENNKENRQESRHEEWSYIASLLQESLQAGNLFAYSIANALIYKSVDMTDVRVEIERGNIYALTMLAFELREDEYRKNREHTEGVYPNQGCNYLIEAAEHGEPAACWSIGTEDGTNIATAARYIRRVFECAEYRTLEAKLSDSGSSVYDVRGVDTDLQAQFKKIQNEIFLKARNQITGEHKLFDQLLNGDNFIACYHSAASLGIKSTLELLLKMSPDLFSELVSEDTNWLRIKSLLSVDSQNLVLSMLQDRMKILLTELDGKSIPMVLTNIISEYMVRDPVLLKDIKGFKVQANLVATNNNINKPD